MATNRIKGITIDIGGNTTQLTKALADVDKSLKDTQTQLKDVNKLLKLDPTNVELLRQKQDLLSKAIESTKTRQDELKKALEQAKNAGDTEENRRQQDLLQRELIETEQRLKGYETEMVNSGKATDEAGDAMKNANKSASTFGDTLKAKLTGEAIVSGVKKLGGALKDLALSSITLSDDLATQATVTGLSTDALQEYNYMAELVDVSVDTITGSMTKLTKSMTSARKGTGDANDAFKKLGVSVTDANGKLRDNEDVFNEVIDALGTVANETERDALSMEIFGKSAKELNPLIKAGSNQIKAYAKEAHDMGYVMSKDVIEKNVAASDAIQRMKNATTAVKNEIGSAFAPVIEKAATSLQKLLKWSKENSETLKTVASVVGIVTGAFVAYKAIVAAIEIPTKAAAAAQALLNGTMVANPIVAVTAAMAALFIALDKLSKKEYAVSADTQRLRKEMDALNEEADEAVASWDAVTAAQDRTTKSVQSEFGQYERLYDELKSITDANGKVKKGYEDRAAVIVGILSEALGTEITLTDGVIKNYKDLTQKIKDLIVQKKAELILKSQEEAYTQAIQSREQAALDLIKAEKGRAEAEQKAAKERANLTKLEAEQRELQKQGYNDYNAVYLKDLDARVEAKRKEVKELEAASKSANDAYEKQKGVVNDTTYTIMQYEKNLELAHKGEFDKISTVNASTAKSYGQLGTDGKKALDKLTSDTAASGAALYNAAVQAGKDFLKGFNVGVSDKKTQDVALGSVNQFGDRVLVRFKRSLVENSPSKATEEMGEFLIEGLSQGIQSQAQGVLNQVSTFGRSTLAAFQSSLAGGVSLNAGLAGPAPGTAAGMSSMINMTQGAAPAASGVNVSVTINGNVDNYDELAETIGQKLQQQMARQGRAWA